MKRISKILLRVFIALLLSVLIIFSGFALAERIVFFHFYSNSERFQAISGLWDGYVPQGYCLVDGEDYSLACGYMSNGRASRIYIIPSDGSDARYVEMKTSDDNDHTGHTGGIAVMGDYVYVTATVGCDVFSLKDITDGDGIATQKDTVKTVNDPAYCYVQDGVLYAGSFSRSVEASEERFRLTTPSGDENTAIISAYTLDPSDGKPYSDTPDLIISTTSKAQGMAFIDGERIAIATSYGFSKSHIYIYDTTNASADKDGFDVDGTSVPMLYLDSGCLVDDIVAPPMAEQIIYEDGVIYIMNESASMKYLFGKLTSGSYVYGYKYGK